MAGPEARGRNTHDQRLTDVDERVIVLVSMLCLMEPGTFENAIGDDTIGLAWGKLQLKVPTLMIWIPWCEEYWKVLKIKFCSLS